MLSNVPRRGGGGVLTHPLRSRIFKIQTVGVRWVHELTDCYAKFCFQVTDDVTGQVKDKMLRISVIS